MKQANTQTKRNAGTSFQTVKMYHLEKPYATRTDYPVINGKQYTTAAQAMTLVAYGDSFNMPVRSLDYCVNCEDYQDFSGCIKLINSYNEFDADRILKAANWVLNTQKFYNENNGNNGGNMFKFHIAREGSPAFYVSWNPNWDTKIIKDKEAIAATGTTPAGTLLFWEEYTAEDFKQQMSSLAATIGADEFDIEISHSHKARFWFD